MIAQFKIEQTENGMATCPWELTPNILEIDIDKMVKAGTSPRVKLLNGAYVASNIGHALAITNNAKVRWNWSDSTQGHYIEAPVAI